MPITKFICTRHFNRPIFKTLGLNHKTKHLINVDF